MKRPVSEEEEEGRNKSVLPGDALRDSENLVNGRHRGVSRDVDKNAIDLSCPGPSRVNT